MGLKTWEYFKALRKPLGGKREKLSGRMGFILQQESRADDLEKYLQ
jgi:hypothetical protein